MSAPADGALRPADPGEVESVDHAGTVHAAGAVLWRLSESGDPEIGVVHRPHHRDWSLPKGKVDPGENRAETAVREIAEETGFAATLGRHLATVRYPVGHDRKVVEYWSARAGAGEFVPGGETDRLRWVSPADAAELLTYESDRTVLRAFAEAPAALRTVVLVRHAKAGSRAGWDGRDAERPLVDDGRAQAERLVGLLGAFGVDTLHAVDKVRCHDTLGPAAEAWGVGVVAEPAFADSAVSSDPSAARSRLLALVESPEIAAVCAQGDGIPALVEWFARRAGPGAVSSNRRLSDPPCRKGSVWVLSFADTSTHTSTDTSTDTAGPTLVAADYYRDASF